MAGGPGPSIAQQCQPGAFKLQTRVRSASSTRRAIAFDPAGDGKNSIRAGYGHQLRGQLYQRNRFGALPALRQKFSTAFAGLVPSSGKKLEGEEH